MERENKMDELRVKEMRVEVNIQDYSFGRLTNSSSIQPYIYIYMNIFFQEL